MFHESAARHANEYRDAHSHRLMCRTPRVNTFQSVKVCSRKPQRGARHKEGDVDAGHPKNKTCSQTPPSQAAWAAAPATTMCPLTTTRSFDIQHPILLSIPSHGTPPTGLFVRAGGGFGRADITARREARKNKNACGLTEKSTTAAA